jgi:hypothetical protein
VITLFLHVVTSRYNFSQPGGVTMEQMNEALDAFAKRLRLGELVSPQTNIPPNTPLHTPTTGNVFLWSVNEDYVPARKKSGKLKFHKLPWNFHLSLSSLRTCIEHWENGVAWINEGDQVITHHTVPFKSLETMDFTHEATRNKFNKLKYVISVLEKVIPANTTLRSCYEEFIVPFLTKVVKSQTRKYKNVKVREIKPMSWSKYLHAYEKVNTISRPSATLMSATNVATAALMTTAEAVNANERGNNNRLDGFRIGLNAARSAMGDSLPQYNLQQIL